MDGRVLYASSNAQHSEVEAFRNADKTAPPMGMIHGQRAHYVGPAELQGEEAMMTLKTAVGELAEAQNALLQRLLLPAKQVHDFIETFKSGIKAIRRTEAPDFLVFLAYCFRLLHPFTPAAPSAVAGVPVS
jgi:hypothetical protein